MAMAADLTREEHRTKAMAMIGSTIGLAFAFSLSRAPGSTGVIGVPGIFAMTGVLALAAMLVVWRVVPDVPRERTRARGERRWREFRQALRRSAARAAELRHLRAARGADGALHRGAVRAARRGAAARRALEVYLPVMLGSFVLMLPAILDGPPRGGSRRISSRPSRCSCSRMLALPWLAGSVVTLALFLLLFFTPFNVLEAMLPSLTSRLAPPQAKGIAIGLYSSVQFFGTFVGAAAGGYLYGRWGMPGVVIAERGAARYLAHAAGGERMRARPATLGRGSSAARSPVAQRVRLTNDNARFDEHDSTCRKETQMASVNKVILIGNLGADPETRYLPSGDAVTNIRIATTDTWKDKSGEKQEHTEWHRIAFFGKTAEIAGEYLKKGSPVYVEGRIRTRKWQDKEGQDRYSTEIVADRMQLLGGTRRRRRIDGARARGSDGAAAARSAAPRKGGAFDEMDDDIPF